MATTTYNLIAKQTVGSGGASSVTFSSIPQNFTDLKVVWSARSTASGALAEGMVMTFNGVTSNRSFRRLYGSGLSAGSDNFTNGNVGAMDSAGNTSNTFTNGEAYIPNYTSTNAKSLSVDNVAEDNGSNNELDLMASLWNTSGVGTNITSITLTASFAEFSTFYLYGISNSSTQIASNVPYALGGDVIVNDGTYWYHAFKYSGTFTPLKGLSADILCVAGGGGGAGSSGGGGGAGGLLGFTSQALTASTTYTCTIGAGGTTGAGSGTNGGNSQFASLTAAVGGGGGGSYSYNGSAGGSGGGAGANTGVQMYGGSGTSGQGYAGGNNNISSTVGQRNPGGGGGAGSVGSNATNSSAGNGGVGISTYSSWGLATSTGQNVSSTYYYAGGGGGGTDRSTSDIAGTGGNGGGGAGATSSTGQPANASAGTANTGGGGGGGAAGAPPGYLDSNGGQGGSGIIIVRYAV